MADEYKEPAFPCPYDSKHGMYLRDYFAAHAPEIPQSFERKSRLEEYISDNGNINDPARYKPTQRAVLESLPDWMARWRFEYADAMMKERRK